MCMGCGSHKRNPVEYKTLREDQNGFGVAKIQGLPVNFIKQGNKIIVKFKWRESGDEVVGIAERHADDKYFCKHGVKIAVVKALEQAIAKERERFENEIRPFITRHDSLVDEIHFYTPDIHLKRIRARRRHPEAAQGTVEA